MMREANIRGASNPPPPPLLHSKNKNPANVLLFQIKVNGKKQTSLIIMIKNRLHEVTCTVGEQRTVITIVQRYAKSTVLKLVITRTSWFLSYPNQWLLDLEPEPKQLEASPPQQSGLQLESASLNR